MNKKLLITNRYFIIFLIISVAIILLFLLFGIIKQEEKMEKDIFEVSSSDAISIAHNNASAIEKLLKNSDNFVKDIKKDVIIQKRIEDNLDLLLTKNIKYAYLLYKDKKDTFRFLIDSAKGSEKAMMDQKFDIDSTLWFDVFTNKKEVIIKNKFFQDLSISYLFPVFNKKEVELILVIDFSLKKVEDINKVIDLMKKSVFSMIIIITFSLLIFIIQTLRYRKIKKSSFVDKLTNVYNRNYLQEIESSINLNDYIIAALDIDYFKKVNDTYGHSSGDKVLKEIGRVILSTIRINEDIIIRYGGEEFLILVKIKNKNTNLGLKVINRIFKNIQGNIFYIKKDVFIKITVSIGVNLNPFESRNFEEAFKLSDLALYKAKNNGRNKIMIYEENSTLKA